jgi:hypothetical protein
MSGKMSNVQKINVGVCLKKANECKINWKENLEANYF